MLLLGTALGFLVGLSLGLLGGGGSVLTVPIFVYVLGFEVQQAIAASLAVVGTTAFIGALRQAGGGRIAVGTGVGFGLFAMGGAYAGSQVGLFLPELVQLLLFATVMLIAATLMLLRKERTEAEEEPARSWTVVGPVAFGVGVLTGVVGVGGGFMIVPALVLLLRLPIHRAIATSLLVITMNAASGFAGYAGSVEVPWGPLAGFTGLSILGVFIGTRWMRSASPASLRKGFAIFLILIAVAILVENAMRGLQPTP